MTKRKLIQGVNISTMLTQKTFPICLQNKIQINMDHSKKKTSYFSSETNHAVAETNPFAAASHKPFILCEAIRYNLFLQHSVSAFYVDLHPFIFMRFNTNISNFRFQFSFFFCSSFCRRLGMVTYSLKRLIMQKLETL